MATTIENRSFTVSSDGETTTELENELFPKGTTIQIIADTCSKGDVCIIKDMSGGVVFASITGADNFWLDRQILNRDVRGCVIETMASGVVYFFKPSGRL